MQLFFQIHSLQLLKVGIDEEKSLANLDYVYSFFLLWYHQSYSFCIAFYIAPTNFFFFTYYILACSIRICFCWIKWLQFYIIVSTQCNLVDFFSKYVMFFVYKFVLSSLWMFYKTIQIKFFYLGNFFQFQIELLRNNFYNLQMEVFVMWHNFSSLLLFYFHHCYLLWNCHLPIFFWCPCGKVHHYFSV